jgi:hypothetical protein
VVAMEIFFWRNATSLRNVCTRTDYILVYNIQDPVANSLARN